MSPTSPTREERELQASHPYGTPLVDLKHVRGRRTTKKYDMFIFVKVGIRKLSDLNTVIGNNTRFILIDGVCLQERARLSRNLSHKKIGKHRLQPGVAPCGSMQSEILHPIGKSRVPPCPKGQVTVSEQIRSLANPAHSGRSTHRTRGIVAVSISPEREYCTTKRDMPQWRACPEWDEVSSELAYETTSPYTWVARSWVCTWIARSW